METLGERRVDVKRGLALTLWIAICTCAVLMSGSAQQPTLRKADTAASLWTIGIYTGPSPLELLPPANVRNPVLKGADVNDLKVDTLAHPFMVVEGSRYYMFFTAKDHQTDKGGIGMADSDTDTGKKFTHAKGLREVVVGAGVERTDLVALLLPRGDDDDRNP